MPLGTRIDFGDSRFSGVAVEFTSNVELILQVGFSCYFLRPCVCGLRNVFDCIMDACHRMPSHVDSISSLLL